MTSSTARSRANSAYTVKLLASTALVGSAMFAASVAYAQNEVVTVTGTSIRGERPVGANVITVDRTSIEESGATTISELMTNIPQITGAAGGFGSSGQRNEGGGGAIASPNIHSLGTQASTATLILIDGHVFAPVGQTTNVVDPSVIPAAALQRVDVLPDGESAIYGANAVAGVINYITRRDYSGWETRVSTGIADHYNSFSFSQVFGHNWDTGSVMAVYAYNNRSSLNSRWRNTITDRQDIRLGAMSTATALATFGTGLTTAGVLNPPPAGSLLTLVNAPGVVSGSDPYRGATIPFPSLGNNFQGFNCPVAAISVNNTGNAFLYPYSSGPGSINNPVTANGSGGTQTQNGYNRSVTGGATQGVCDQDFISSQLIADQAQNGIVTIRQQLNDNISVNIDLVRGSHITNTRNARGTTTATVFSPLVGTGGPAFGSNQANPFFVTVPGATGSQRNSEFISFAFDDLLADLPGAYSKNNTTNQFATFGLDADLGGQWALTFGSTLGSSSTGSRSANGVNAAEALLALNGTVNSGGTANSGPTSTALADPYGLGTTVSVTRALTTANALDVWNPVATNRTSQAVRRSLIDSATATTVYNNVSDVTIKVDGPLADLWGAGAIKAAFGTNYNHLTQPQYQTTSNSTGPTSTSARGTQFLNLQRTSYAVFAEFLIPLINEDMGVPLVKKLAFDVSGRWDHFSDFGTTKNPKLALTWDLFSGLSARGSFSTSFVAPNVHDVGGTAGVNSQTSITSTQITSGRTIPFLAAEPTPFSQDPFTARGVGTAGTFVETPNTCLALNGTAGLIGSTAVVVDKPTGATVASGTGPFVGTTGTGAGQAYGCKLTTSSNNGFAGLQIGGANVNLKPERGVTFSAGVDIDAGQFLDFFQGLTASVTYYNTKFIDVITNQQVQANIPEATSFGPNVGTGGLPGWAPTDPNIQALVAGRALNGILPTRIYTIVDNRIQNPFTIWQAGLDFQINYRIETDSFGTWTFGANGNQIIRFSQKANSAAAALLDVNDCKNNARYCSSEMSGSLKVGWRFEDISAGVTFNFTHPYWSPNSTFPFNLSTAGAVQSSGTFVAGGFEHVGSLQTVDLNFSYTLPDAWISGSQVNVTVTNVLDKPPPFFNNNNGFTNGSELGRLINVGLVKKW